MEKYVVCSKREKSDNADSDKSIIENFNTDLAKSTKNNQTVEENVFSPVTQITRKQAFNKMCMATLTAASVVFLQTRMTAASSDIKTSKPTGPGR